MSDLTAMGRFTGGASADLHSLICATALGGDRSRQARPSIRQRTTPDEWFENMTMQSDRFAAVGGGARIVPAPAEDIPVIDGDEHSQSDVPENALDAISAIPSTQGSANVASGWGGGFFSLVLHGGLAAALMTFGFNLEIPAVEGETAVMVTIIGNAPQDEMAAGDAEGPASVLLPPLVPLAGPPPVFFNPEPAPRAVEQSPAPTLPGIAPALSPVLTAPVPSKSFVAPPPVEQVLKLVEKPAVHKAETAKPVEKARPVAKAGAAQKTEAKPKPSTVEANSRENTKTEKVKAKLVEKKAAEINTPAVSPGKAKSSKTKTGQANGKGGIAKGTGKANTNKGSADGSEKGQSAAKSSGKAAGKTGNASASNYAGLVQRKIARTRQKSAGARGNVTISFSVTASGGLAAVSVARSSGMSAVDAAALDHVRRSAPFPAPPAGAQTRFQIPVTIR